MSDRLLSVGLDVGTTSTQMIFSELTVENKAGSFSVPEMEIAGRKIRYKSPVHFTPLIREELVDAAALRRIVDEEYRKAGIRKEDVDTGAIIITGETSRKENARSVLAELSGYAGDFVVATAGPDLESVLAAKGAGAADYSRRTGKRVLHMDIGGGTSNLALIEDGKITATTCLNVGGRLLKFRNDGRIAYVSPVLKKICSLKVGDAPTENQVVQVARVLVHGLETAAGLREKTEISDYLRTAEAEAEWIPPGEGTVISFSGGVADCIGKDTPALAYGDMGPILGRCIRESRLCRGESMLGEETIRATVIGAGCHSAQLSGSTVYHRGISFPMKNLPVVVLDRPEPDIIRRELKKQEGPAVLALPGIASPGYDKLVGYASAIAEGAGETILVCMEQDMAKALGQKLALITPKPILCIDRVKLTGESYLDVGAPVGPALPVVVKTLVLNRK